MSLATAGAGGAGLGGGGLSTAAMAHNAGGVPGGLAAQHQQHHQGIPGGGGPGMSAPGTTMFAGAADLLDKNQSFLNGKNVRAVAKMPLVAVDLYGDSCGVAYFPPNKDEGGGSNGKGMDDEMVGMMRAMAKVKKGVLARSVGDYGETNVTLKKDDATAYKAVKRYLNKGEGHGAVLEDALVISQTKGDDIVIPRPHLVMGIRRTSDLNAAAKSKFSSILPDEDENADNGNFSAIDQTNTTSPVSITTIAMDGSSQPKGDDYDRVAFQMKLNSKKKLMTILPEEALALVIAQCKKKVKEEHAIAENGFEEIKEEGDDDDEEAYMDYPPAFAIPGWAATDSTIEALIDAAGGSGGGTCGPTLHQRSVAACVGALLPPPTDGNASNAKPAPPPASKLAKLLTETMQAKDADAAKEAAKEAGLNRTDPVEPDPFVPLVVLAGATEEGVELTAVQITKPQGADKELHCPFGNVSVISSVCHALGGEDSTKGVFESALDELREQIGVAVPESEEPTAVVTYGSIEKQLELASVLKTVLTKYGEDGQGNDDWDGWDQDIPLVSTREDCVPLGTAVLGASVHGRVRVIISVKGTDGKMRPKAKAGLTVQDVATCAVAVSFNYFGGTETNDNKQDRWTEPKVIFDFDRRVPAGPYQIDFTAAECAAHIKHCGATNDNCMEDESALIEMTNSLKGSKGIPQREAAALQLRFRVYQRTARDGQWIQIGDEMRPLSMQHSQKDEGEDGESHFVAIESAVLEISLNTVGLLTTGLITNGETIVQATKSARNSKLLRYGTIIGSILFIGGFLVKSYVEERIFERDTQRVLAYYKHAAANSFHDGDERQARYLVWKYKAKKEKLWRRLEAKYGVPVKHAWEWDDEEDAAKENEEDEAEDLDGGDEGSEKSEQADEL